MNLRMLTLDQFLCVGACTIAAANPGAFHAAATVVEPVVGDHLRALGKGFDLHQLMSDPGDVAILRDGTLVGFYLGELLAVDPACRGQRLSVPLVLAAVPARALPEHRALSPEGQAALTRAWRVANGLEPNPWP